MLQRVLVALGYHFGHPFLVFLARLHQSTQVLLGLREHISASQQKVMGKVIAELHNPRAHRLQWEHTGNPPT